MKLVLFLKDIKDQDTPVWKKDETYPILSMGKTSLIVATEIFGESRGISRADVGKVYRYEWCSGERGASDKCARCSGCPEGGKE